MNKPNINVTHISFKCSPQECEDFLRKYHNRQSMEILGREYFIRSVDVKREKLNFQWQNPHDAMVSVGMELFKLEKFNEG